MYILISLKEPQMTLIIKGEIKNEKPEDQKEWDRIFHDQVLQLESPNGNIVLVPLLKDYNIAFMQNMTDEEFKKQEEELKRRREEAARRGERPSLVSPQFTFPSGRSGKG